MSAPAPTLTPPPAPAVRPGRFRGAPRWDADPLEEAAQAERQAHVHGLVDALVARLEQDRAR